MNQAIPRIKEALQSRLLFMGRYQLQSGPPLHKSATCVVVNAEDFNASEDYKQAFAKFNKPAISKAEFSTAVASFGINWTRDEFERQFARIDADGTRTVDEAEFIEFCKSVLDNGGNRKSERPSTAEIGVLMKQVTEAVDHLHEKNLMHGDIKMNNVVRQNNRLRMIDFDAAADLGDGKSLAGSKFSSGVLPPEMFVPLNSTELAAHTEYWANADSELRKKVAARNAEGKSFAVKTFAVKEDDSPRDLDALPFHTLAASKSLDVWSLGCMLFHMCASMSLFPVNRDDDMAYPQGLQDAARWTIDDMQGSLAQHIEDPAAADLLGHMLHPEPSQRWTTAKILDHIFFNPERRVDEGEVGELLVEMKQNQLDMIAKIEGVQATQDELVAGQAQIIKMGVATQDLVKKSTSKLCKAVFEATEASTPTRFVILPYELPPPTEMMSEEEQQSMLVKAESWVGTVTNLVDEGQGAIQDPASYATNFLTGAFKSKMAEVKEKLVEEHLYLYLVDEYSNQPVYDKTGVYPIKIETKSELVDK
ncbi:hypothetical protein TeGR_g11827 [Tetraparma gracilis]|uniref:Calmodulin n=1 Tax=Tetraparma gracilis TaxID=2962635 RepID=A0ABQ6N1B7_9STRA|nr:hypothetical protein TeGR_g11827 [Tetraparma gracilis]